MSLDVSIRPKVFVGMRIYSVPFELWATITSLEGGNDYPVLCDDGRKNWTGEDPINCPNILLSGEPGCPQDLKNLDWDWKVGEEFWVLENRAGDSAWFRHRITKVLESALEVDIGGGVALFTKNYHLILNALHIPMEQPIISQDLPNKCPRCGSPAYIGLNVIECSKGC